MEIFNYDDVIVKSNYLIESPCKLTLTEKKIVYSLLKQINRADEEFQKYTFEIDSFIKEIGIVHGQNKYTELRKITKLLRSRTFTIKFNNKETIELMGGITEIQTGWITNAIYKKGEGKIIFTLDPALKPFLLNLKRRFTELSYNDLMLLRSKHSTKIYELLIQYSNINGKNSDLWERTFNLDELKHILGLPENKYKLYAHFKSRILTSSQKELSEKTGISFEFAEVKNGKKVEKVKFSVKKEPQSANNSIHILDIIDTFRKLTGFELHYKRVQDLITSKGLPRVMFYLNNFNKFIRPSIKDLAKCFYTAVQEEWPLPASVGAKPVQETNYYQRFYDDTHYDSLYDNLLDTDKD